MTEKNEKPGKLLVLGFDAATFDIMDPLLKEGKLPNFKKLMDEGASGELRSTVPPITPPAWASFMTGKNPGRHGVYNFLSPPKDPSVENESYCVNSFSIKANTIWEILSERKKKNIVINIPVTYPLTKHMNGILISGLLTPNDANDFAYPPSILEELSANVEDYEVDSHPSVDSPQVDQISVLEHFIEIDEKRARASLYLMKNHPWDFFMVMFGFTDKNLHIAYPHLNKNFSESRKLAEYVEKTYLKADELLGYFLDELDDDTTICIVSDHGFGSMEKGFMTNSWLNANGYMALKKTTLSNFSTIYKFKLRWMPINKVLSRLHLNPLRYLLPSSIREWLFPVPKFYRRVERSVVDWSKTSVYGSNFGLRINLKGRETTGIVEPGEEYEKIREELIEKFYAIKDPGTGKQVVDKVWKREELFRGTYIEDAPDIMFMMDKMNIIQYDFYHFKTHFKRFDHGTHRMNGIFMIKGPGVKKGAKIEGAEITDAAPTLFYSMGESIPEDMDGRLLDEAYRGDYIESWSPRYSKPLPLLRETANDRDIFTEEEEEKIKTGLQGLGYW